MSFYHIINAGLSEISANTEKEASEKERSPVLLRGGHASSHGEGGDNEGKLN